MRVVVPLLMFAIERCAESANRKSPSAFLHGLQSPAAGADVRRYGAEKAAMAYGLRQETDRFLFIEGLTSVISESPRPSRDQIAEVIGSHRRRWRK